MKTINSRFDVFGVEQDFACTTTAPSGRHVIEEHESKLFAGEILCPECFRILEELGDIWPAQEQVSKI